MKKPRQKNKLVLGVTGSFGSGKSTVACLLAGRYGVIIDADKVCHGLIKPGNKVYSKVINAFGGRILDKKGRIDRKKLAEIVFADQKKLSRLNKIIHPEAIKAIKQRIAAVKRGMVIVDAPLLIEAGLVNSVDKLVVVDIRKYNQLKRLLKKNITKDQILKRISLQMPLKEKACLADFIIDNNGSLKNTKNQVEQITRRKLWTN